MTNCPNCGAPIMYEHNHNCQYCGTLIKLEKTENIRTQKEMNEALSRIMTITDVEIKKLDEWGHSIVIITALCFDSKEKRICHSIDKPITLNDLYRVVYRLPAEWRDFADDIIEIYEKRTAEKYDCIDLETGKKGIFARWRR